MTARPTREEAARRLGLSAAAGPHELKRTYRRLAREHHPDLGGDPDLFHDLQRAYERLVEDSDPPPRVSRGRPSRPSVPFVDDTEIADLQRVDWSAPLPDGDLRLDPDRLARWLADEVDRAVRPIEAASRAPGSRLNGIAQHLAAGLTSTLRVAEVEDDRRRSVVAVDVIGATRRARRALDAVTLGGGWVRTRHATSTRLRATLTPSRDRRATALRATDQLTALLDALRWPLRSWTVTADRRHPL